MIDCTVTQKLLQLYLDNALEEAETLALQRHIAQCKACRVAFLDLERLALALETLPRLSAPPQLFRKTMDQVRQQGLRPRPTPLWQKAAVPLTALLGAVAMVFALQSGLELAQALSEVELSDPFTMMEDLLLIAASVEFSLAVGAGLLFVAGCGGLLQLVSWGRMARPA